MEEASGKKLQSFFYQWVYTAGYPRFEVRKSYDAENKEVRVTVSQVQKADGKVLDAYSFPLEIEVTTEAGSSVHKVDISKREETFNFPASNIVTKVSIDPLEKVILKSVKMIE